MSISCFVFHIECCSSRAFPLHFAKWSSNLVYSHRLQQSSKSDSPSLSLQILTGCTFFCTTTPTMIILATKRRDVPDFLYLAFVFVMPKDGVCMHLACCCNFKSIMGDAQLLFIALDGVLEKCVSSTDKF